MLIRKDRRGIPLVLPGHTLPLSSPYPATFLEASSRAKLAFSVMRGCQATILSICREEDSKAEHKFVIVPCQELPITVYASKHVGTQWIFLMFAPLLDGGGRPWLRVVGSRGKSLEQERKGEG